MTDAKDNPGYVDSALLDAIIQFTRPIKQRSYALTHLTTGHRVLDVGCGPATDTIPLAHLVGPTGQVVGIDYDAEMIRAANQRAEQAGVHAWVRHDHADAAALPYEAHIFDAARSERVFQHVPEPAPILAEMIRVTKAGGWVVVADTDHSGLSIDCAERALIDVEWRLRRYRADMLMNGYAGRQLYRLFKTQGLRDVTVEIFPLAGTEYAAGRYFSVMDTVEQRALADGMVTEEELQRWRAMLEQADEAGVFFGYGIMLLVAGRTP